jgi:hypothetical protein
MINNIMENMNLSVLINNFNLLIKKYEKERLRIYNILIKDNFSEDNKNKKYIQLYFNTENNDKNISNNIVLNKNNYIIQYSLYIELLDYNKNKDYNFTISLGIKDNKNNKLRILNGSKLEKNLIIESIEGVAILNNCFLYNAIENYEELYIIISNSNDININNKKSVIKILTC